MKTKRLLEKAIYCEEQYYVLQNYKNRRVTLFSNPTYTVS